MAFTNGVVKIAELLEHQAKAERQPKHKDWWLGNEEEMKNQDEDDIEFSDTFLQLSVIVGT